MPQRCGAMTMTPAVPAPWTVAVAARSISALPFRIAVAEGLLGEICPAPTVYLAQDELGAGQALLQGAAQLAICQPDVVLGKAGRTLSLRIVAGMVDRPPHAIIGKRGIGDMAGLRGGILGVPSHSPVLTCLAREILAASGLQESECQVVATASMDELWHRLRLGEVTAGLLMEPLGQQAEAAGFTPLGRAAAFVPDWPCASVCVDDRWAAQHPERVAALLRGITAATGRLASRPEAFAAVAAEVLGTAPAVARQVLRRVHDLGAFSSDLSVPAPGLERLSAARRRMGKPDGGEAAPAWPVAADYLRLSRDVPVRDIASRFFGGGVVTLREQLVREVRYASDAAPLRVDPNGEYQQGQVYAQFVHLGSPRCPWPILFLNSGTSTGAMWESTPDGRAGWQSFFLRQGYNTVLVDAVGKGRASWARFPDIFVEPVFRPNEETWPLLRIGPRYDTDRNKRAVFHGGRFPVHCWEDYAKQTVPRFPGFDSKDLDAIGVLLQQLGPAIVIGQSSGAYTGLQLAAHHPGLVQALVALELTAVPNAAVHAAALAAVPQLLFWGDNLSQGPWPDIRAAVDAYVVAMQDRGAAIEVLDLPAKGIHGNTHQLMMDFNSDALALMASRWLERTLGAGPAAT